MYLRIPDSQRRWGYFSYTLGIGFPVQATTHWRLEVFVAILK